jgi:tRNA(Ile)-lysidine synthase
VSDLLQRVECNFQNRRLPGRGQTVLVAVSGGPDSMTLLHLLHKLSAQQRWKLAVAHFNHQLRGRSSGADERLVRKTAAMMGLPVIAERASVKQFAEKSKLSIEMAARKLRHEFFARAAKKRGIRIVALAHHADDQVELFFLRLLRGAGGEGLAGMKWRSPSPADSRITLVRPLLDSTKAELQEFARENKISFREDATNTSFAAPRNRIRNELLPLLRKKYQPGLAKTVLRLMEIIGAEADAVTDIAQQWLKKINGNGPTDSLRMLERGIPAFARLPIAVQRRALQLQLAQLGVLVDFDLVEQLRESANRFVSVNGTLSVLRETSGLVKLRMLQPADFNPGGLAVKLSGRAGGVNFNGILVRWRFRGTKVFSRPSTKAAREFFDAEKVGEQITLRHWRPGDRFQPIGMKSALKLQDWFVNQRIPRALRRELLVAVAESGEIFWVEGLRIGGHFKLTAQTKRCLIWRWRRTGTKKGQ